MTPVKCLIGTSPGPNFVTTSFLHPNWMRCSERYCFFKMRSADQQSIRSEEVISMLLGISYFSIRGWCGVVDKETAGILVGPLIFNSIIWRVFSVESRIVPLYLYAWAILHPPRKRGNATTSFSELADETFTDDDEPIMVKAEKRVVEPDKLSSVPAQSQGSYLSIVKMVSLCVIRAQPTAARGYEEVPHSRSLIRY